MAQDGIEATVRRQLTRSDIQKIANGLIVRLGLPALIFVAIIIGLFVFKSGSAEKTAIWLFIVAVALLIISFIQGQMFNAQSKLLYESVRDELRISSKNTKEEVKQIVEENVDPHVTVLRNLSTVRGAAAELIEQAIHSDKDSKESFGVIYFGSASLTPSEEEFREASHSENYEQSDIVRYQNALNDLKNKGAKVRRFIRLLESDLFKLRDPKTREEYLNWLEDQVARLKTNPNYILYDARRAPEWGGPRSSIITKNGVLDIIGDGSAGFQLLSARIPSVIYDVSSKYFWAARLDQNKPKPYTADEAPKLQSKVDELKEIHRELLLSKAT